VRRLATALALATVALSVPAVAAETRGCATRPGPGGEWSGYGGDVAQRNNQAAERTIGAANVAGLTQVWTAAVDSGQSTPVVAGGCVYVIGSGMLTALDVATGRTVWTNQVVPSGDCGSYCPGAPEVVHGRVHVGYSDKGNLSARAFDARTGEPLWRTRVGQFGYRQDQLASARVARGLHLVFGEGPDFDPHARPGFALLDERTGRVRLKRLMVPEALARKGFAAGGVWATPAVDEARGYAYVGTANPYSAKEEARYSNSIMKIDIDPRRRTFGAVVSSYKGDPDVLTQLQYEAPTCQVVGPVVAFGPFPCAQTDSDFGAGPTLFRHEGRRYLAEPQKSGTLHVLDPDTMRLRWKATIGLANWTTRLDGNSGEVAYDGERLYVVGNPGVLRAFDPQTGAEFWQQPVLDNYTNYRPTVVANGVLYVLSGVESLLTAWSTEDGSLLAQLPMSSGTNARCGAAQSGGIAVAQHKVVVNCGSFVAAFALGVPT
jgi:polyvinyl alcohol dehydrogenase (cytochrome)